MEPSNSKLKRISIVVKDKLKIITRIENGGKQRTVSQAYGLSKRTMNTGIWKKCDNLPTQRMMPVWTSKPVASGGTATRTHFLT